MKSNKYIYTILALLFIQLSCKNFLDIDAPKTSVATESVFMDNDLATSAILGMYQGLTAGSFAFGSNSVTFLGGLSSDELISQGAFPEFYENEIDPISTDISSFYLSAYNTILKANSVLEGIESSTSLTPSVKLQLQGEAFFMRAFCYFYLVNFYGEIPLQLSPDIKITRVAVKSSVDNIYRQIIKDLQASEALLTDQYVTTERVRPNLSAVQALLARVYLFNQDWANAERYSSIVIAKTSTYGLLPLDNVFLKNSQEAIWQLAYPASSSSIEGNIFILTATPTIVSLNSSFAKTAFEANDKRATSWVKSFTSAAGTFYFPYKYKVKATTNTTEYSMVLRVAEQYLIRSEARAMQGKLIDAIKDLDLIRIRAGAAINNTGANSTNPFKTIEFSNPNITQQDLIIAIQKERRVELFTEWGHRWLDLKRTGKADQVLSAIKPKWQLTDVLYPIPFSETSRNTNIGQNLGY